MRIKSIASGLIANWPSKILALTAAVLMFVFNRMNNLRERELEVPLEVILPRGFVVAAPYPEMVIIAIRGDDEGDILSVAAEEFWVFVDLSDLTTEGEYQLPVRYTRRGSAIDSTVFVARVEPTEISVTVEDELTKILPVKPVLKGSPKYGYILSRFVVTPNVVNLRGPRTRIESVTQVTTDQIDLTGRESDFAQRINLVLHEPFVTIESESSVEFQAIVEKVVTIKEFTDLRIEGLNLDESLKWDEAKDSGAITVQGSLIQLEAVSQNDIRLAVDFGEINEPGQYSLAVATVVPAGLSVRRFEPSEIQVELTSRSGQKESE